MNAELPDYSRSRAILIGTATYQDKGFPPLPAAANSLKGMQEILVDSRLCRWPAERVTVLADPADIRRLVTNLRRWARDTSEVLLLYFVGHGTITPRGELCLAVSDTEPDDPDVTGIEYERVRSALLDSPARVKVVILDCCYSGRAIQALSDPDHIADITDVRGVYTITASDHAAHVPPLDQQARACTSFTGELLDLIRTGIPGGPETLTLNMIYSHLRTRLRQRRLPAPNQRGTDSVGEFGFTRNASLLPEPIARFPQSPPARRTWPRRIAAAAAAAALVAAAVLATAKIIGSGARALPAPCGVDTPVPTGTAKNTVVVGSADFPESALLAQIYAQALTAKGITVTTWPPLSRENYFPLVCTGQITIVPEYNGALLTFVDPNTKAITTGQVDTALKAELPRWLTILVASRAQDTDTVTVTAATAARYHLKSIADLAGHAQSMVFGGPDEWPSRTLGGLGLQNKYGLHFKFKPLDHSGPKTIQALKSGAVQAADVFSTSPWITIDDLVPLTDPQHMFIAENIVPLVYKYGVSPAITSVLDAVSAKLTTTELRQLDTKIMVDRESPAAAARTWLRQVGLG